MRSDIATLTFNPATALAPIRAVAGLSVLLGRVSGLWLGFPKQCRFCFVRSDSGVEHLAERGNSIVVIVAGDFPAQPPCPFFATLLGNFVEVERPKFRPGGFDLVQTKQPILLAFGFDRCVVFQLLFEQGDGFGESRGGNLLADLLMLL